MPAWLTASGLSHLQCSLGPQTHIQAGSPHFSYSNQYTLIDTPTGQTTLDNLS